MNLLLAAAMTLSHADEEMMDAGRFLRLIHGLHSEIEDVSFVYEGVVNWPEAKEKDVGSFHQGTYAYRRDGATLLDFYVRDRKPEGLFANETYAILKNRMESASRAPDLKKAMRRVTSPIPDLLNRPGSASRFFLIWFFREVDTTKVSFQQEGWEDVDGHRCIKVLFANRRDGKIVNGTRFWVDLSRGGHPLKAEWINGDGVRFRTDQVKLKSIKQGGGKPDLWIPVSAVVSGFATLDGLSKEPGNIETYDVVTGSIRVNVGLPDSQFKVDWTGGMPETESLQKIRAEFDSTPELRTDPSGVKKNLDERLAKAERQGKMLDASASAAEASGWHVPWPVVLGVLGTVLLAASLVIRRRR